MVDLTAGRNLTPRYKLVRRFGRSGIAGMIDVWLVEDEELGQNVVAKILSPDAPPSLVQLLKREFVLSRALSHENIVRAYDFHQQDGSTFFAFSAFFTVAYVDGVSLSLFEGRPLPELLPILVSLADALDHAHRRGVVHRDLKPSNVVVDGSGAPHLADFGIAGLLARADVAGGGTPGYSSPEQLEGAPPAVTDDIYGFGALALKLLTGESPADALPESVPAPIRPLLASLLSSDPARRPGSMAIVRKELEALRDRKALPEIKPPARLAAPAAPRVARGTGSGVGVKTIGAFVVLGGLAAFVFAVLPDLVRERRTTPPSPVAVDTAAEEPAEADVDLRDLAREKTLAEGARGKASRLKNALDSQNAVVWGGEDYRDGLTRFSAAQASFETRDYARAAAQFEDAARAFEAISKRAQGIATSAIEAGERALSTGNSLEARERFTFALSLDPGSDRAKRGAARAATLDEVLDLVAQGEARERRGDLKGAAESYRRAAALDPLVPGAQHGLARVDAASSERAFRAAMTEAVAAIGRGAYDEAKGALERAKAIRPEAREIEDGFARIAEGLLARDIATHQRLAREHERSEDWRAAEKEYDAVLALDPTIRAAREGKANASARGLLTDKLDFAIAHPERLSDGNALREASLLVEQARGVESEGPRHRERVEKLEALVQSYGAPVVLHLVSDKLTDVTVTRVGRLGRFDEKTLELRPGRYTVLGTRNGYRDVRREIEIQPGKGVEPVLIRCVEEL